ncbi:MAG: electron transfer flavoprotein subunit beta/FixA family protein [Candidatus Thermoplasmatota archaeon]|nr:electron transfer flavoprotein subunit beta/FixA family protein [Candidatus Thermoplasmatota archaeon]
MPVNIIVLFKQIIDIDLLKADPSTGSPLVQNLPLRLETLSKNAIEEAVRIKEKKGGKVYGLCFGTEKASSALKEAYAMGVDEGLIITGYERNDPTRTAKVLAEKIKTIPHDIVMMGNQSAESYTGLLAGKIAKILGEPLLSNAIKVDVEEGKARVVMATESENLTAEAATPLVISVTQEINEPRLPPVMQILQAGKKPINMEATSISGSSEVQVISNLAPKSERKKLVFEDPEKGIPEVSKAIREAIK